MNSEKQPPAPEEVKREADVYDLLAWLEVNKKKVGIAAVVLVGVGFLAATLRHFSRQKEEKAASELLALRPTLVQPTNTVPAQASAFAKVAESYKGTSAGERAHIFAATTLFTEGRYADAEKEFARFVQEFSGSPWAPQAAYGVAASQEANNKGNEAFASYQSVVTAYGGSSVAREAKLALARIHETRKQPDQALRLYNELLAPVPGAGPGGPGSEEAEQRKEALLRAHPNLNTNSVAPAPVSISSAPATNVTGTVVTTNAPAAPSNLQPAAATNP